LKVDFSMDDLPKPFFVLAPMDDVTDTVFRQIVASTAAPDMYFTEFVNVDGLQSPGRPKLLPKLLYGERERPIFAQLWGKTPESYYKSAQDIVRMGFDGVDINMGCPAKPIIQNGCCSALINNRGLTGEILHAVREGVDSIKPGFPVSVKTRLGFKNVDLTWHEYLLQHKLNMLTIHGRTTAQMSKVPADWDLIGEVAKLRTSLSPSTLIVGNGDVLSRSQGNKLAQKHSLDGIMIGRGVFHDPYVFSEKSPWGSMTKQQKLDLYTSHVKLFADTWKNNERKLVTLNKFCKVYIEGFPGAKELREKLMAAQTIDDLLNQLHMHRS
jgi:tRNA-dihydrouridine synthase